MSRSFLLATLATLAFGTAANAEPIDVKFEVGDADGTVITHCDCEINVDAAGGLGTVIGGTLDVGESMDFDFLDISFDGTGIGLALIGATLSFLEPDVVAIGVGGVVPFLSIEGFIDIAAGIVIMPDILAQVGDSLLNISFDDYFIGIGGAATISGSITHVATAIPEPGTLALMLIGIGMLAFVRRRRPQPIARA